jgi:hypothetical protein
LTEIGSGREPTAIAGLVLKAIPPQTDIPSLRSRGEVIGCVSILSLARSNGDQYADFGNEY